MAKFKICPECGKHNAPNILECVECEMDLSDVPITDENEQEKQAQHKAGATVAANTAKVRVCEECGAKNPVNARKCQACGEDISDIVPTDDVAPATAEPLYYVLGSLDGSYSFELTECHNVVGRENLMKEYLASKSYVSRKHAEFVIEENKLVLKDCGATNHCFVNNEMLAPNGEQELHDGDVVGLGGNEVAGKRQDLAAYFMIRIK